MFIVFNQTKYEPKYNTKIHTLKSSHDTVRVLCLTGIIVLLGLIVTAVYNMYLDVRSSNTTFSEYENIPEYNFNLKI